MKRRYTAAAAMMMVMGLCASASAAFDENLNDYTLDAMVVEADAVKNKFGDTITEQSYYRTGGDVKVITREEIEKRHYVDMTEAIKRIPGITFKILVIVVANMVLGSIIILLLLMAMTELLF